MSGLILKAIVTGLILSVMLGPAFFLLLETSIRKGIRAALAFDAGVLIADVIYIVIAYIFIQQIEELSQGGENAIIRAIGGVLFLTYGYLTYFRKVNKVELKNFKTPKSENPKDYWIHFIKGLFLNLANPLVVFYWFSVMAFGRTGVGNSLSTFEMVIFLITVLGTFFFIDIVKIVGAKKLRPFITASFLSSMNRITGTILMVFGAFLLVNSVVIWVK
ncbi:MAG TPA: LysE family transporter [Brumimicrobium sp.]|nr:LysE family transporter [Brumimicrobium sp.]